MDIEVDSNELRRVNNCVYSLHFVVSFVQRNSGGVAVPEREQPAPHSAGPRRREQRAPQYGRRRERSSKIVAEIVTLVDTIKLIKLSVISVTF